MKVDVDYQNVLEAIEKLENGKELTPSERKDIVLVLKAVQGDYIPTMEEMESQVINVKALENVNYDKNPERYNMLLKMCSEFENKYC